MADPEREYEAPDDDGDLLADVGGWPGAKLLAIGGYSVRRCAAMRRGPGGR